MNFTSVSGKKWIFKHFNLSEIKEYSETYSLSETTAKLLSIRKNNIEDIQLYLNPTIKNCLPNPLKLKDMGNAIERSYKTIKGKEKIGIFGDYDVDGATSTALLVRYFKSINQKIESYIPDRKKEGYGPTVEGFNKLIDSGVKIIFTVDCGTLSYEPIYEAQKKDVDVIVLDHHQSDIKLPNAFAIVNPNRYDDKSNLNYLCAAGVCFMFLVALNSKLRSIDWFKINNIKEPDILKFLDLVSLGTVCDVVPLIGLNRAIVKQGLKIIEKRNNLGLKTLYDLCKIESRPSTFDLGYKIGPRINAGGRVGKSSHGVDLLTSTDPQKAFQIAKDLNKSNDDRKAIELILSEQVEKQIKKTHNKSVIVLAGENWHQGVIGIIASRIKDKYNKPTIIISTKEQHGRGSARSLHGFDIGTQIIKAVQLGILQKGGGHKMAGGFSIKKEKIVVFDEFLNKNFNQINKNPGEVNLYIDSLISPSAVNQDFYKDVNCLAPFGSGNNEPIFVIENIKVLKSNIVGNNHIKSVLLGKDGTVIKSIAFNAAGTPLESYLNENYKSYFNIAGKMTLNEWKGVQNIEFIIFDISKS